ncbi:myotubularin related protein 6 [Tachypleus tridentatus]|uniref:myotubularin related protein 6 n=1 Tax=Tachypleus tridentatus TaxID=6853 RepID=UPI003FD55A34
MEHIKTPKLENVRMLDRFNSKKPSLGTLYLTATHLIFVDPEGKKETWVLHMHIASIEKLPISTTGCPLQIRCKNFLSVTFVIPRERDCHEVYNSLLHLSQPLNLEDLYCFHYTASNESLPKSFGWNKFNLQAEYTRMGVPNKHWVLTTINLDYEICDTYPKYLYVPANASTPVLVGSSRFRSRGRLPVLSYLHKNEAALSRCSQPLSGFSARCVEDEQLLTCILRTCPSSKFMYVVDTRPKINAMANKAAGKGYENESFYENIKFQFFGIENIHVMRSSLNKLIEVSELKIPSMNAFLTGLESSGWLKHVRSIIETAVFIAKALEDRISVLVHCSDGWDRTAQTCSLASLILDPYYRTVTGFQALIEKEWLAFGHKFTDRCGHIQGDPREIAPVFTQFIDAVWQLSQQFLTAFQFNERFLLTIHDHVFSCQFGTFIGNCEKDRVDLKLSERTYSLWGYINNHMSEFLNPLYKKDQERLLTPSLAPQGFRFWRGMYNRFENGVHPREPLGDLLLATKDHISSLEDHVILLHKVMIFVTKLIEVRHLIVFIINFKLMFVSLKLILLQRICQLKEVLGHVDSPGKDIDSRMTDSGMADEIDGLTFCPNTLEELGIELEGSENSVRDSGVGDVESGGMDSFLQHSSSGSTLDPSVIQQLADELDSVALDWKSFRNVRECLCSTPFDHFSRKFHCWSCGDVYCIRCIDKRIPLQGHYSKRPVSVCRHCYKELMRTNSIDS